MTNIGVVEDQPAASGPGSRRPRGKVRVRYAGRWYTRDLVKIGQALTRLRVEGRARNLGELAGLAQTSRSTTYRLVMGRTTSVATTRRILNALGLEFEEVHQAE